MVRKRLEEAKRAVRELWREYGPDWAGIAPSHLSVHLHCGYGEATSLLLELWQAGFVEDTGHGGRLVYPDGHVGTNRFVPTHAKVVRQ